MTARRPITISDDEMEIEPIRAPARRRPNVEVYDPRAALGVNEIRDMIPHVESRNAGVPIFNQHQMTVAELHCLTRLLKSLSCHTAQPVTMASLRSILEYSFDGWDTSQDAGHPPPLTERKFNESRVQAGVLSQDHPLPASRT